MSEALALSGGRRVRRWRSVSEKLEIVQLTLKPGATVAEVARAHVVNANQVFMYGPSPCCKRKMRMVGWPSQMYPSPASGSRERSSLTCVIPTIHAIDESVELAFDIFLRVLAVDFSPITTPHHTRQTSC